MSKSDIQLNDVTHEYVVNGIKTPSVTQVLRSAGLIDFAFVGPEDLTRGTFVHKATEYYDENRLNWSTVDPICKPFVDGWIKFREESGFIIEAIEEKLYSAKYRYTGKLDRRGIWRGKRTVLDIATGFEYKPYKAIQTEAYLQAYNETCLVKDRIKDRLVVVLPGDGTYK